MFDRDMRGGGRRGGRPGGRLAGWGGEGEPSDEMGRGRGGGRRRMFDTGELRLALLALIAEAPRHGYDLIRAIEERAGGAYVPSPGVIYPTVTLLSEMGLIVEQAADGARKLFAITPEGSAHLAAKTQEVAALFGRLDALGAMRRKTDPAPVRRAVHNLRLVLINKLGDGLDDDRLHAAVALIDDAAQKIERL